MHILNETKGGNHSEGRSAFLVPAPLDCCPPPSRDSWEKEGPRPSITEARVPGERCAKGCGGEGAVCGGRGGRGVTGRGRPAASRRAAPQANPSGPPFQSRPQCRVRWATGSGGEGMIRVNGEGRQLLRRNRNPNPKMAEILNKKKKNATTTGAGRRGVKKSLLAAQTASRCCGLSL